MKQNIVFLHIRLKNSLTIVLIIGSFLAIFLIALNFFIISLSTNTTNRFMEGLAKNGGFDPNDGKGFVENINGNWPDKGVVDFPGDGKKHTVAPRRYSSDIKQYLADRFYGRPHGFMDYYTCLLDENYEKLSVIHDFYFMRLGDVENQIVSYSIKKRKNQGRYNGIAFMIAPQEKGYMLILVDKINENDQQRKVILFSVGIFLVGLLIFFVIAWVVSKRILHTVWNIFDKQRQFVANASHELKTPVAVVSANISVLEKEVPGNKWVDYIKKENLRMGQLVIDMLYLAREDSGGEKYERKSFDLSNATACALLPFESVAFEEGKKFDLELPEKPVMVVGDEKKIRQVAIILMDNAMKNTDKNDSIKVSVGLSGQKAFLRVYNTGKGIREEEMKKVFDRFYRADSSRARATGGCGLGLSIAQTIASGHDGKIYVESELEKYAQFTLSIPCSGPKRHMDLYRI